MSRRIGLLRTLGLDLIGPLVVYRVGRDAGLSTVWSLALAATPPAFGVLADLLHRRKLDVVGAVVLAGIALSMVLALVSDDPTVILLKGAVLTAAFGIACLVSLAGRRPLIFYFAQAFYGGRHSTDGTKLDRGYDRYPEARFYWRMVTAVWGIAYVAEAAVLYVVIESASTGAALTFSRTVPWLVFGLLLAWMFWWGARVAEQDSEHPPAPSADSADG